MKQRLPRYLPVLTLLVLLHLLATASGGAEVRAMNRAHDDDGGLERIRTLYHAAVSDEAAIEQGLEEIDARRVALRAGPGAPHLGATLTAYEGAFITLRAKHGVWPPRRLAHLRDGLALLDAVVVATPDLAEARYLRLMSCYYLPGILGRGDSVREDFAALARLLPEVKGAYPRDLYEAIVNFVLENGEPHPEDRAALLRSLASAGG